MVLASSDAFLALLPSVLGAASALLAFLSSMHRRRYRGVEDGLLSALGAETERAQRAEERAEKAEGALARCRRQLSRLSAARRARQKDASPGG